MKNNKTLYTVIAVIGVAVIIFSLLKMTGVYDITALFGADDEPEVIDVWESDPFGEYDVTVKLESYTDGKILQYIQCDNSDLVINYDYMFYDSVAGFGIDAIKYKDCDLASCAGDEKNSVKYFAFAIPTDTDYMMLNGNRLNPVVGKIDTFEGPVDFKLCCVSLNKNEVDINYVDFLFVDEEGNKHRPITE